MKQIHAAVILLKLPDYAPDQPFPVSAVACQSQPAEFFCPEPIAWQSLLWAIWGKNSENGGSKAIKTAPKELKEKYQQVLA